MCESKVHACVNPSCSALCVSSMTRLAGGLVWSVTPKFMSSLLILARARDGGGGAEGQVDPPRYVAPHPPEARARAPPLQPVCGRPASERVQAVGEQTEDGERGAEDDYLRPGGATRGVDELRQEGQEEERDLRVKYLDQHALRKDARKARRSSGRQLLAFVAVAGQEVLEAEVDEVGRAQPLHDGEGCRRGDQDRGE